MRKIVTSALACAAFLFSAPVVAQSNFWNKVDEGNSPSATVRVFTPTHFLTYTLDETSLKNEIWSASDVPEDGVVISLPMPDGSFSDFRVWRSDMMPAKMQDKYPDIRTFTGEAINDRAITAKIDFTVYGFHAMIFNGDNTSFIDPYDNFHDGYYIVHYKKDETRQFDERMKCLVSESGHELGTGEVNIEQAKGHSTLRIVNAAQLRTYRLALACDHQYAIAATGISTPTKAEALSKMTTSMNRINGVYEREFSIHMNFVANEDTLIFVNDTADPYGSIDGFASALLSKNQTICDSLIGNANYDVGHVFTTAGGGLSYVANICHTGDKARSETGGSHPVGDGFDIDYVAHEMGHEYGGDHTFNNNMDGSCSGNANESTAFEPGSGSTIMAYVGICSPDDIQPHSDAYFHFASLKQIIAYSIDGSGSTCAVKTSTGNKLVSYPAFAASYYIPYETPFELTAPALTDSVADSVNLYCWEQANLGDFGAELVSTHVAGPIFRSFDPDTSRTRIFPKLSMVLAGTLSDAGVEDNQGEKAPDVARYLTFRCTFRDIYHNYGAITIPDDTIHLNAVNTGAGFKVTSQNTTGINYSSATTQSVTWDVVGSNLSPINCTSVDIYLSADGGHTWPYYLGNFDNSGTAIVTIPTVSSTTTARIKVKGSGNVFFNINSKDFSINHPDAVPLVSAGSSTLNVYPIPARDVLHLSVDNATVSCRVLNAIGQSAWQGSVTGVADINVASWPRGIYYVETTENTVSSTRKIVLE